MVRAAGPIMWQPLQYWPGFEARALRSYCSEPVKAFISSRMSPALSLRGVVKI